MRNLLESWWFGAFMGVALVACGSEVVVEGPVDDEDDPPVASGGNAPRPVAGGGGSTSSTSTTSTTTGVGGSSGKLCGDGQPPCPPSEFCDFPGESCGPQGTCTTKPEGCYDDCPGVCGCDGVGYCNACTAQISGVDVADDLGCL